MSDDFEEDCFEDDAPPTQRSPSGMDILNKIRQYQTQSRKQDIMFDDTPKFQLRGSKIGSKFIPYDLVRDLSTPNMTEKFLKNRVSLSFRGLYNHGVESLKIYIAEEIIPKIESFEYNWTMNIATEGDSNHFRAELMFESEVDVKKVEEYLVIDKLSKE